MSTSPILLGDLTFRRAQSMAQKYKCTIDEQIKNEAFRRFAQWYMDFPEPNLKGSLRILRGGLANPLERDDLKDVLRLKLVDDVEAFLDTPMHDWRTIRKIEASLGFFGALALELERTDRDSDQGTFQSSMEVLPEEMLYGKVPYEP